MSNIFFTKDHEWIRFDGDIAVIGITDYAQEQLGDIVFVELPELGKFLEKGSEAVIVESVKAASEVYAPLEGEVVEINDALNENPALVNSAALADGWFIKIKNFNKAECDEMMDEAAYKKFIEESV